MLIDLIGNVWEWCSEEEEFWSPLLTPSRLDSRAYLRGGSWLDDLERTRPFLDSRALKNGDATSHTDLGFRIAAREPYGRGVGIVVSSVMPSRRLV